jgi:hypothetical protein
MHKIKLCLLAVVGFAALAVAPASAMPQLRLWRVWVRWPWRWVQYRHRTRLLSRAYSGNCDRGANRRIESNRARVGGRCDDLVDAKWSRQVVLTGAGG